MLTRRNLLARMPAAVPAAMVAVTQAPAIVSKLAAPTALAIRTPTVEENIARFLESVEWLATKPIQGLPAFGEVVTLNSLRAVSQWEIYSQLVTRLAVNFAIPVEKAFELTGVPLSLLPR